MVSARASLRVPRLESLEVEECLRRLAEAGFGRLAMAGEEAPELLPVNFALRDNSLIIRTGEGSILAAARLGEAASFEIDGIERLEHTGWSVIVRGKLSELETNEENLALPLRPWASGRKDRFVALSMSRISGMQIPPGRGNR